MNARLHHIGATVVLALLTATFALPAVKAGSGSATSHSSNTATAAYSAARQVSELRATAAFHTKVGTSRLGTVMIVPGPGAAPEALGTLLEDMSIMARIVDKKLPPSHAPHKVPFLGDMPLYGNYLGGAGPRTTEALYLDGYGALFFTSVDMPLTPPPQPTEPETDEAVDRVWHEAQASMYGRPAAPQSTPQRPAYSAQAVADLKATLTDTLKHAANIRALAAQDWITLVVADSSGDRRDGEPLDYVILATTGELPPVDTAPAPDLGAVGTLVVRARKKDVDDLVAKRVPAADFKDKVEVIVSCAYHRSGSRPAPARQGMTPAQSVPEASTSSGRDAS